MRYLSIFVILAALAGCVTMDFYSKLNPTYPAGNQYQRILIQFMDVQGDYAEFGERTTADEIAKLFGTNVKTYLYSKEFYTGSVSRAQWLAQLREFEAAHDIDAVIVCSGGRDSKIDHGWSNGAYFNNDQNIVGYRMELIDVTVGKSVWYSTDKSTGNAFWNSDKDLIKGFIEKAVMDMELKSLLGSDNRPSPYVTATPTVAAQDVKTPL